MIERALDLLIERVEKQRFARTKSARGSKASDPEMSQESTQISIMLTRPFAVVAKLRASSGLAALAFAARSGFDAEGLAAE